MKYKQRIKVQFQEFDMTDVQNHYKVQCLYDFNQQ